MNKHEILKKIRKYTSYLAFFFMIVGAIFAFAVENKIPALITFTLFAICVTVNIILDSYFYYKDMNLERGQKKGLLYAFIFEIIFWTLICINFLVALFGISSFIYKIVCYILIILSAFLSMFFADLENCKHDKATKTFICIMYTVGLIMVCAASL